MITNADKKCRMPIFRDRLDKLRGDLSYADFAKKLGLSRATVGFYLAGSRVPDAETLKTIAEKCGVSADYLIGLSDYSNFDLSHKTAEEIGIPEYSALWLSELRSAKPEFFEIIPVLFGEKDFRDALLDVFSLAPYAIAPAKTDIGCLCEESPEEFVSSCQLDRHVLSETKGKRITCGAGEYAALLAFRSQSKFYNAILSAYKKLQEGD